MWQFTRWTPTRQRQNWDTLTGVKERPFSRVQLLVFKIVTGLEHTHFQLIYKTVEDKKRIQEKKLGAGEGFGRGMKYIQRNLS